MAAAYEVLDAARVQAGMTLEELWLAYYALGGMLLPAQLFAYLQGEGEGLDDYDVVAQALNERFRDQDLDSPVAYRNEMP